MTIYYVDATGGDDANDGISESAPWKTFDPKVNESSFNPGDEILAKDVGHHRGETLFPSSGEPDNPIIIGSYGSGGKAKFLGSKNGSEADFWMDAIENQERDTDLNSDSWGGYPDNLWIRNVFNCNTFSEEGAQVRILLEAHSEMGIEITGVSVGQRNGTTPDYSEFPTRLTFDDGIFGITVNAGEQKWTDWIDYRWDCTRGHLIHINLNTDDENKYFVRRKYDTSAEWWDGYYRGSNQGDKTLIQDVTHEHYDANNVFWIRKIEIRSGMNTWASPNESFTHDVGMVFHDTDINPTNPDRATKVNKKKDLEQAWDFWHDPTNNRVIIYHEGGNPADQTGGIEVTYNKGNDAIFKLDGKSHVLIDDFDFRHANGKSVYLKDCLDVVAKNCDFYASYSYGRVAWMLNCQDCVFDNFYMYRANASGKINNDSESIFIESSTDCIVRVCELDEHHHVGINFLWSTNCIAEYNKVHDMDPQHNNVGHAGIYFDGCNGGIARYNECYGNLIGLEIGAEIEGTVSDGVIFHDNLCYLNFTNYSVYKKLGSIVDSKLHHNISAHYPSGSHKTETYSRDFTVHGSSGTEIKHCIIHGESTVAYDTLFVDGGASELDLDHNLWGPGENAKWNYLGVEYDSLEDYRLGTNQDVNSIEWRFDRK